MTLQIYIRTCSPFVPLEKVFVLRHRRVLRTSEICLLVYKCSSWHLQEKYETVLSFVVMFEEQVYRRRKTGRPVWGPLLGGEPGSNGEGPTSGILWEAERGPPDVRRLSNQVAPKSPPQDAPFNAGQLSFHAWQGQWLLSWWLMVRHFVIATNTLVENSIWRPQCLQVTLDMIRLMV